MSDNKAIDRIIALGALVEHPLGGDRHVLANEDQIRALVAEQVALAVAEKTCAYDMSSGNESTTSSCGIGTSKWTIGKFCCNCGGKIVKKGLIL